MPVEGPNTAQASELRERGNALYKSGQLVEAISLYEKACSAAPTDPLPLSNLSAAFFETGDYQNCIKITLKAIRLVEPVAGSLRQRLHSRLLKSHVHSLQWKNAKVALKKVQHDEEHEASSKTIVQAEAIWNACPDVNNYRSKIIDILPRFLPSICSVPEYCTVGHDLAFPQLDRKLVLNGSNKETISLLFGGIGDARHLYATLIYIADSERVIPEFPRRRYHFTALDLNARTIARDIILLFLLVEEIQPPDDTNPSSTSSNLRIATAFYIFLGPIMPNWAYECLQDTISKAIDVLNGKQPLPASICVYEHDRTTLTEALRSWQSGMEERWPTKKIRSLTAKEYRTGYGTNKAPDGCAADKQLYSYTGALFASAALHDLHEPQLKTLRANYDRKPSKAAVIAIREHVDRNWRPNVTLIDPEYLDSIRSRTPDIIHDPFEVMARRLNTHEPKGANGVWDYAFPFFTVLVDSIAQLQGRLVIELFVGELSRSLEELRYSTLTHRRGKALNNADSAAFPTKYDRVHMSNIPDYIGGPLTSFLYAIPVTKPRPTSHITSNVLRNIYIFSLVDYNAFLAEFMLTSNKDTIFKLTKAKLVDVPGAPKSGFLDDYYSWSWQDNAPFKYAELLDRASLERWLYALFLKITTPYERDPLNWSEMIFCSLNVTVMYRVLDSLSKLGYPAHWLSAFLSSVLSGHITTTARAPRSSPLRADEAGKGWPPRKICTKPFCEEMRTQAAIWMRTLPFGFVSPHVPALGDIYRFTVNLNDGDFLPYATQLPHFVLMFSNNDARPRVSGARTTLRSILLDDETSPQGAAVNKAREEGLLVVSVFEWTSVVNHERPEAASFWLDRKVVERMLGGNWSYSIWRNDRWGSSSKMFNVEERNIERRERWVDVVSA